jgi:hypothetical protein
MSAAPCNSDHWPLEDGRDERELLLELPLVTDLFWPSRAEERSKLVAGNLSFRGSLPPNF